MNIIILLIIIAVVIIAFLASVRFFRARESGTPILIRQLPADKGKQWRHSVLTYSGRAAKIYKLRSLKIDPDIVLPRSIIQITGRRAMEPEETQTIDPGMNIIQLKTTAPGITAWEGAGEDTVYEIALAQSDDNAFVSWLESQPSARQKGLHGSGWQ